MRTDMPEPSSSRPDLAARHAARLDACWPCVRVESVRVVPTAGAERASALVQLGGLTPADVRVELFEYDATEGKPAALHDQLRMFSTRTYDNGCFVFDVSLPAGDPARPREWMIHVHPSEALEEPRVLFRFRSGAP